MVIFHGRRRLIDAAARVHRLGSIVAVALGTGARLGELRGLRWEDVDIDAATIRIESSCVEVAGVAHEKSPKSASSRRTIAVPQFVVESLAAIPRRSAYVFAGRSGKPVRIGVVYRDIFGPACRDAGIERLRFHDLRHTHASALLRAGVPIKVVSTRLGHASVELTLRTYCHLLPGVDRTAAEKIEEIFRNSC